MRYSGIQIVFQEIPNEISLAIHITGCPLRCLGCHSSDLWNGLQGFDLDHPSLIQLINKYRKYITCLVFMGGEWHTDQLIKHTQSAKKMGLKVALYSGFEQSELSKNLVSELDYLKHGRYIKALGGLKSPTTNQRLINLKTGEILNHYFTEEISL